MSNYQRAQSRGATFSCSAIDSTQQLGPLNIDYVHLYRCEFKNFEFFFSLFVVIWVIILIDVLGKTASDYFTPTLASISNKWRLSNNFAGITLVALANGAPDIFSSVIGLTTTGSADVSIGALLGGGLFVCTVVVGCIAILSPCDLSGFYFTRDSFFLLITVVALATLGAHEKVTLLSAFSLCFIYAIYIIVVLISPFLEGQVAKFLRHRGSIPAMNSAALGRLTTVQTAFWSRGLGNGDEGNDESDTGYKMEPISLPLSKTSSLDDSDSINLPGPAVTAYKFLILDEYSQHDAPYGEEYGGSSAQLKGKPKNNEKEEIMINLSGGLLSRSFSWNILNSYFEVRDLNLLTEDARADTKKGENRKSKGNVTAEDSEIRRSRSSSSDMGEFLVRPLLLDEERGEIIEAHDSKINQTSIFSGLFTGIQSCHGNSTKMLTQIIYQRFMKRIGKDWNEITIIEKFLFVIEYPFVIARDLTIPTLEADLWCRKYAAIQPLLCCLFLRFLSGGVENVMNSTAITVFLSVITILPFLYMFFFTHQDHPPSDGTFVHFWLFLGFIMCVSWIYLLAGELVNCLTSVGNVFDIPPYYLALTVLAWGNSIGDLVSNIAVAKRGMGEMAIAGCYGGPVFNILIGMGISLTIICYRDYPHPYRLVLDQSAIVSIGFLCAVLICTIGFATYLQFRLNALMGYFLITSYILYTITQTVIVISGK